LQIWGGGGNAPARYWALTQKKPSTKFGGGKKNETSAEKISSQKPTTKTEKDGKERAALGVRLPFRQNEFANFFVGGGKKSFNTLDQFTGKGPSINWVHCGKHTKLDPRQIGQVLKNPKDRRGGYKGGGPPPPRKELGKISKGKKRKKKNGQKGGRCMFGEPLYSRRHDEKKGEGKNRSGKPFETDRILN